MYAYMRANAMLYVCMHAMHVCMYVTHVLRRRVFSCGLMMHLCEEWVGESICVCGVMWCRVTLAGAMHLFLYVCVRFCM